MLREIAGGEGWWEEAKLWREHERRRDNALRALELKVDALLVEKTETNAKLDGILQLLQGERLPTWHSSDKGEEGEGQREGSSASAAAPAAVFAGAAAAKGGAKTGQGAVTGAVTGVKGSGNSTGKAKKWKERAATSGGTVPGGGAVTGAATCGNASRNTAIVMEPKVEEATSGAHRKFDIRGWLAASPRSGASPRSPRSGMLYGSRSSFSGSRSFLRGSPEQSPQTATGKPPGLALSNHDRPALVHQPKPVARRIRQLTGKS